MTGYPPDPIPMSEVPRLALYSGTQQPLLLPAFKCTAILHPFAPPQSVVTTGPFYQRCTANIAFGDAEFFRCKSKAPNTVRSST